MAAKGHADGAENGKEPEHGFGKQPEQGVDAQMHALLEP
jgi:hypothetical protein